MEPKQSQRIKKWVPRPLDYTCGVCSGPASDVQQYGSISCYSCRAFFRRSIGSGKEYGKCVRGTDACVVDQVTRTNCKKCRFKKCLQVGMKPEKVDKSRGRIYSSHTSDCEKRKGPKKLDFSIQTVNESEIKVNTVDICTIAEECVIKETGMLANTEFNNYLDPITYSMCTLSSKLSPVLELTLEEEFRIYELDAMKENMIDGCFKIYLGFPNFLENISKVMTSLSQGAGWGFSKERVLSFHKKTRNYFRHEMNNCGKFRNLINSSFYVFNNVPDEIRIETFGFSLSVVDICMRAFLKVNSDKESFIEQKKAAGIQNATLLQIVDHIFPINRNALKSMDDYAIAIFESPWAEKLEDEEFFYCTLQTVGEIVKDDVKLGTLYIFLVLATPGADLSQASKTDPALGRIQQEITLLLYRYLKTKHNDTEVASHTLNKLLQMVGDLHRCRSIHLFGRMNDGEENGLDIF